jgi:hypothetical protein
MIVQKHDKMGCFLSTPDMIQEDESPVTKSEKVLKDGIGCIENALRVLNHSQSRLGNISRTQKEEHVSRSIRNLEDTGKNLSKMIERFESKSVTTRDVTLTFNSYVAKMETLNTWVKILENY